MSKLSYVLIGILVLTGCEIVKQSSKFGLKEGYYESRIYHKKTKKIYLVPGDDSIKVYTVKRLQKVANDSSQSLKMAFPATGRPGQFADYHIKQGSFDIDVLSILFKYRPSVKHFPNQFNTSVLNGAFYFGHRSDLYDIKYKQNPFGVYQRNITHYGFSYGIFTGLGASRIDEFVTQAGVSIQYDGFVNVSGVAVIMAVDKISFGLTTGLDHLLDKNHKLWIYQGKPWIGLSVGLNLN